MRNDVTLNIARFILLALAQIVIFNKINFLGFINPYPYILFILLFPISEKKTALLIFSFLLGLTIDMFCNTGGIHAAASVFIAFMRQNVLAWVFGTAYEYNVINISVMPFSQQLIYVLILVFSHHLVLFVLEVFNFTDILYILKNTLFSGIFSALLILLFIVLFKPKRK